MSGSILPLSACVISILSILTNIPFWGPSLCQGLVALSDIREFQKWPVNEWMINEYYVGRVVGHLWTLGRKEFQIWDIVAWLFLPTESNWTMKNSVTLPRSISFQYSGAHVIHLQQVCHRSETKFHRALYLLPCGRSLAYWPQPLEVTGWHVWFLKLSACVNISKWCPVHVCHPQPLP